MQEAAAPGIFTPPNAKAAASIGRGEQRQRNMP
jgi:hypothetical protein